MSDVTCISNAIEASNPRAAHELLLLVCDWTGQHKLRIQIGQLTTMEDEALCSPSYQLPQV
jgi:hypothetical protein